MKMKQLRMLLKKGKQVNIMFKTATNLQLSLGHNQGGLGLVYYEPQGDAPTVSFETVLQEDGFSMPFRAHLKKVKLASEGVVLPLLKVVRMYADMEKAPKGIEVPKLSSTD